MRKDLLSISDLSVEEIQLILRRAYDIRKKPWKYEDMLKGKTLVMIFEKPSTRTRVSFEVGMKQLGGSAICLNWNDMQLSRGESIKDTARTLERYADGIMARVFRHSTLQELAKHAKIPVISGLSDLEHPCQALADIYTIWEKKKILKGLKFAYLGDGGGNVCHSLMLACTKLGMSMHVACPKEYGPEKGVLKLAEENSRKFWSALKIAPSAKLAAANADVIYTDTWVSMGEEKERAIREKAFRPFLVNSEILKHAKPDCIVMHCLPAHRGQEITDEVIDGPNSVVFDQAENRLHVQKAILSFLMGEPEKQKFRLLE